MSGLSPEQKALRFEKLSAFLSAKQLAVTSPNGHVRITVDGFGELLSIGIDAPDGSDASDVGPKVVRTVAEARAKAEKLRRAGKTRLFTEMVEES